VASMKTAGSCRRCKRQNMFRLEKQFRFEAAHRLPNHDGKCQRLHGHSWIGRVIVEGDELQTSWPKAGMLMDFGDMANPVKLLVEGYLDHHYLNETLPLLANPTSEEIARWIFNQLK